MPWARTFPLCCDQSQPYDAGAMFVGVNRVHTKGRHDQNLHVLETRCDRGRVAQHILASFERLDEIRPASGLDRVLQGLAVTR